jgi:hypothetical protein
LVFDAQPVPSSSVIHQPGQRQGHGISMRTCHHSGAVAWHSTRHAGSSEPRQATPLPPTLDSPRGKACPHPEPMPTYLPVEEGTDRLVGHGLGLGRVGSRLGVHYKTCHPSTQYTSSTVSTSWLTHMSRSIGLGGDQDETAPGKAPPTRLGTHEGSRPKIRRRTQAPLLLHSYAQGLDRHMGGRRKGERGRKRGQKALGWKWE